MKTTFALMIAMTAALTLPTIAVDAYSAASEHTALKHYASNYGPVYATVRPKHETEIVLPVINIPETTIAAPVPEFYARQFRIHAEWRHTRLLKRSNRLPVRHVPIEL